MNVRLWKWAILPYFQFVTIVSRLLTKLAQPPHEVREANLRDWASTVPDAVPIAEVREREHQKVSGVIQNIRINPAGGASVEATVVDGTGELVAKWLGRPSVAGLKLGAGLVMEGRVGRGPDGELVILNPDYQLVTGPEHG